MKAYQDDYIIALEKAHEDENAFQMIKSLINEHFAMVDHMKKTSLYDVYMYEQRIANNTIEPMKIMAYENEQLKREVNGLRKRLGLCEKYKEHM